MRDLYNQSVTRTFEDGFLAVTGRGVEGDLRLLRHQRDR